jgi:hypothetical protein
MTFTDKEIFYLAHILRHFTDYIAYDDRPDHGLAILKDYRNLPEEEKRFLFRLAGRIGRVNRKRREKK